MVFACVLLLCDPLAANQYRLCVDRGAALAQDWCHSVPLMKGDA